MPVSLTVGGRRVITAARSVQGNLSVCALYHNRPLQSNTRPRQAGPPPAGPPPPLFPKKPQRGRPRHGARGGRPPPRGGPPPLLRPEALQVQPLDHVPERRELLQLLRPRLAGRLYLPRLTLLQRLALLVQAHARLLQHRLLGVDRHLGAYRQGDGVAGARVDLQALPVHV